MWAPAPREPTLVGEANCLLEKDPASVATQGPGEAPPLREAVGLWVAASDAWAPNHSGKPELPGSHKEFPRETSKSCMGSHNLGCLQQGFYLT